MSRPVDWWVLGLKNDPTPGSLDNLTTLSNRFLEFAENAETVHTKIEAMRNDDKLLTWTGQSGDAFREQFGEFPGQLEKLRDSHRMAGEALKRFHTKLEEAQRKADRALSEGREIEASLGRARERFRVAEEDFAAVSAQAEAAQQHIPPDPDAIGTALRNLETSRLAKVAAENACSSAEEQLRGQKTLAEQAREMREEAAYQCAREIREASDAGIKPRSFWDKIGDTLSGVWNVVCTAAKWIGYAAAAVAFVIGGPVAWIAVGANAILLVDALIEVAQGKGNWLNVVMALAGCIPNTTGITNWARVSGLFRYGGAKAVGRASRDRMKEWLKDGIAEIKTAWKTDGKAWGVTKLAGKTGWNLILEKVQKMTSLFSKTNKGMPSVADPVDVSTGRVFMPMTDVHLGAGTGLSLLLERTHRSDHGIGRYFGPAWASTLDQRILLVRDRVLLVRADGSLLRYPMPGPDQVVSPEHGSPLPLRRTADGFLVTDPARGWTYLFATPEVNATDTLDEQSVEISRELLPSRTTDPEPGGADLVLITDAAGRRVEFIRDEAGRPIEVRHSEGGTVRITTEGALVTALHLVPHPDAEPEFLAGFGYTGGQLTEVVNASGLPLRFTYDTDGRMTSWLDRNGMWYRYTYDADGRCVRTEGRDGYLSYEFRYEPGRTHATDSLGHTTVFELNEDQQVVAETDPLGNVVRSEWDSAQRLLARTDQLGRTTRFRYGPDGHLEVVVRPDGSTVDLVADEHRVLSAGTEADGRELRREYAPEESPDPYRDFSGQSAATPSYRGTPIPGARERLLDGEGNEIAVIDAAGRISRAEYGAFDLLVATITPSGARTVYGYDTELRLTSVTDPEGRVWRYRYDPAGRLVHETDFDGRVRTYDYDAAGHLTRVTNNAGEIAELSYDVLGNLIERRARGTGQETTTTFTYDALGRIVAATGPDARLTVHRADDGRVLAETVDGRTLAYTGDGTTVSRRTPAGVESHWTLGPGRRPEQVVVGGHTLRFRHAADGRVTERRMDGHTGVTLGHDPDGRLTEQRVDSPAGVLDRGFDYTPDGRLVTIRQDGVTIEVGYDHDGRIIAFGGERYVYDASGEIVDGPGGPRTHHGTDLLTAGATRFTYDAEGRLISRTDGDRTWLYRWDPDSRLIGLTGPDGTAWRYRYDPYGRRIAKERLIAGRAVERTTFTWDGPLLAEQVDPDGTVTTWEHDGDRRDPVLQVTAARADLLVTDQTGAVWEPGRRSLWGGQASGTTPLRFAGQYLDEESGLHYNVNRYYDPSTGRYLSHDPMGLRPAPSPVRYVDNPLQESDPLGLVRCNPNYVFGWDRAYVRDYVPYRPPAGNYTPRIDGFLI